MANKVEVSFQGVCEPSWTERAAAFTAAALKKLGRHNWKVSLLFCCNAVIKNLNARYRFVDEPTDVLSFVLGEADGAYFLPGDIVISLDALAENTVFFDVSPEDELRRLLIHGILHLAGMDHATNETSEPMLQKQEALLGELSAEPAIMEADSKRKSGEAFKKK